MGTTKNTENIEDTLKELQILLKPAELVPDLEKDGWVTRLQISKVLKVCPDTVTRRMEGLIDSGKAEFCKGRKDSGQVISMYRILK
jgi:predicted ArsR family transcriptional regulator